MRQKRARGYPLISIGIVLILIAVAPTVIGMVREFGRLQQNGQSDAVAERIRVAFHPLVIGCGTLGFLLVATGFVKLLAQPEK